MVEGNPLTVLENAQFTTSIFLRSIPAEKWSYRYEEGKWSVAEVLNHLMDTERIFTTRALRIARGDVLPQPGFDQDDYVRSTELENRDPHSFIAEYRAVRGATLAFFKSLAGNAWTRRGKANQSVLSVRAVAYILAGHEIHHLRILKERYLHDVPSIPSPSLPAQWHFTESEATDLLRRDVFIELLEHGSMTLELFVPRGADRQQPHDRDEIYVVLSGSGVFRNGKAKVDFGPGDVLFVPAGTEHRFEEFSADFKTWVIFYGPRGGETNAP